VQTTSGWKLTIAERKRILLDNIYGVDIDPQAVEVTKLSLLLKVLEGESEQTIQPFLRLFQQRALPDLGANIKCGNSLIGPDFYQEQNLPLMSDDDRLRVNVFDWDAEFPEIMKSGGFGAVIGNPPWISLTGKFGAKIYPISEIDYLVIRYKGNTYMPNMYEFFVARVLSLIRDAGYFSFVVPDRLGYNNQFTELRKRILEETKIISLLYKVPFPGITADTLIFVFQKGVNQRHITNIAEYSRRGTQRPQADWLSSPGHIFEYFENNDIMQLIRKINSPDKTISLGGVFNSTSGFGGKSRLIHKVRSNHKQIQTLKGDSISRYQIRKIYWFEFILENITGRTTDKEKLGASPKILLRKTGDRIVATYDESGIFPEQSLYFLYNNQTEIDTKFFLGVLNSRLLTKYFRAKSVTNKKSFAQVKKIDLDQLPFPNLNVRVSHDKISQNTMVKLVNQMLDLHKRLPQVKIPHEKEALQRQIAANDEQIDQLTYRLYGLNSEEIKIVEKMD
jgi:hypothetical protein